jgi:hypothetical protein
VLTDQDNPSIAFFEIFITNKSIGIRIGMLKIDINVLLLEAFEAMPDIKVNTAEKPVPASNKFNKNN